MRCILLLMGCISSIFLLPVVAQALGCVNYHETPDGVVATCETAELVATCSVSPTTVNTGSSVTWSVSATGGYEDKNFSTGATTPVPKTYEWAFTSPGGDSTASVQQVTDSYTVAGTVQGVATAHSVDKSASCSKSVTVKEVVQPAQQPIINSFTASPSAVTSGSSASLEWQTANVTACTITPDCSATFDSSTQTGSCRTANLTSATTYTLICHNTAGAEAKWVLTVGINTNTVTDGTQGGACRTSGTPCDSGLSCVSGKCQLPPTCSYNCSQCTTKEREDQSACPFRDNPPGCSGAPLPPYLTCPAPAVPACEYTYGDWGACHDIGGNVWIKERPYEKVTVGACNGQPQNIRTSCNNPNAGTCTATSCPNGRCNAGVCEAVTNDNADTCPAGKICNPVQSNDLYAFLGKALKEFVKILIPIIVLFYVITGLMFVTARGNPEKLKVAKMALLGTTIGAAVVLGAWLIAQMIDVTIKSVIT